jgi:hypothetical protein
MRVERVTQTGPRVVPKPFPSTTRKLNKLGLDQTFFLHSDITGDIMSPKKLKKVRKKIEELRRRGGVSTGEIEAIAQKLGRNRHKRGKEPCWISTILLDSTPISIPSHCTDLNRFTARTILDRLEQDVDDIEAFLSSQTPTSTSEEIDDEPIN